MTTKVTLRKKAITKGRQSLYLDFYPAILSPKTGEPTRREFLGLYVYKKPKNEVEKAHNLNQIGLGNTICSKRENELNKPEIYTDFEKEQLRLKQLADSDFVEYFEKLANKRKSDNHDNWTSALTYFKDFSEGSIRFGDITEKYLEEFKEYLLTTKSKKSDKTSLAQNSAVSYFNKVKATLKQAFKDGILQSDLNARVTPIKQEETRREFLTIEELNSLIKTQCNNPLLKRAALFSALTGLRFSDIENLTWGEVEFINGRGYFLNFDQEKTKGIEVHPISEQAFNILGSRGSTQERVFEGLKYSAFENKHLYQWIGAAGITKDITFHNFRHTYATLQLANGTDIYTVSKLLGHKSLKTTQVYAKVVDELKRDAADRIKLDF